MAATTLLNSKSLPGGRYRHLRKQLPSYAAAVKAMAHYLAVLVYRADQRRGLGGSRRSEIRAEARRTGTGHLKSKALAHGFKLTPIAEAQ